MKFVCDGLTLSEAVAKVSKACAVRTTAPVLECIKITAGNEEITFLATDGELSIQKTAKAEVFEEGEICVPGKTFGRRDMSFYLREGIGNQIRRKHFFYAGNKCRRIPQN